MSMLSRLLHLVRLGRVSAVDDTGSVQRIQVTEAAPGADGSPAVVDAVPVLGLFGLASSPPLKSDVLVVRLYGGRTLSIALGTNHQPSRLRGLSPGDAALYDQRGAYVWLTPDGLVIDGAGLPATVRNVTTLRVEGEVRVTGDVVADCDGAAISLRALHDAYNAHKHGGVQAGGALTQTTDHPT